MQEVKTFKQNDLVLKVHPVYDPALLDLDAWDPFLDRLCSNRPYQKEAIRHAVIYLASGRYQTLRELAEENYRKNPNLQEKYPSFDRFCQNLQLPDQLYATLDLATGTGKSYVIYGIAQILLGIGLVDRVLVLCPSLTIETGLTEKFEALSGDALLKSLIPPEAVCKNPRIINANSTIQKGDLCVENIHAVYANTGSSIEDSLLDCGERVLVLNDEAHHIFNKTSRENTDIKKWKEFLQNPQYRFRYMLGFTGTAYIGDEYFADVIYRFSLRNAIESRIVKNVDYVQEDDSANDQERFQKIYQNHQENKRLYPLIKPLTILVTKDISRAKALHNSLIEFLMQYASLPRETAEQKVLLVTSHQSHKMNLFKLRTVDQPENPAEWIVSVSMLTEGWDVKNVFQIVPMEERAFNSKLLVAQVLGRGLRVPEAYRSPQPKVTVFNHKSWSGKIRELVNEVLEIEKRLYSHVLEDGARAAFHFEVQNIRYTGQQEEIETSSENTTMDFSRLLTEGIVLESQAVTEEKSTLYQSALGYEAVQRSYSIVKDTVSIDELLDKLYDEFEQREWEGKALRLGEDEYTQNQLPPRETIRRIIEISMEKRGNQGDLLTEKNAHKILTAFSTLLRRKNKTVVTRSTMENLFTVSTRDLEQQSLGIGGLRRGASVFYSTGWEDEITDPEQRMMMQEVIDDLSLARSAVMPVNEFQFKTPVTLVLTSSEPERRFTELLCKSKYAGILSAWIKSRDRKFYEIEYSCRLGSKDSKTRKYLHANFNPDYFIEVIRDGMRYILVVEIKADGDISAENCAKYKYGAEHFRQLNRQMEQMGINDRYLFHFLSPNGYAAFFQCMLDGSLFENPSAFRCDLENLLEQNME